MNEIVERSEAGRFVTGHRGLGGRPVGARNRFSEAFVGDIAVSWAKHGAAVLERLVADDPAKYADICSRLIPRDVALTVEQRLPGGLDRADLEILQAIKSAIRDAGAREPGEVFEHVLEAVRAQNAKLLDATCTQHEK